MLAKKFSLKCFADADGTMSIFVRWSPGNPFVVSRNIFYGMGVNAGVNTDHASIVVYFSPVQN